MGDSGGLTCASTLGSAFERRPNALNAIRLGLALMVIVWHAYALGGSTGLPSPAVQLLGYLPVDGFFAVSGFLICRAWHRRPDLRRYAAARARRILPGLWVCLLATAFVIAPMVAGSPAPVDQWRYVVANATTWRFELGIGGTPVGVPEAGTWNGSLWSIGYEVGCYAAVAMLGAAQLLRARLLVVLAAFFWMLSACMMLLGIPEMFGWLRVPRCGLMFTCGALLFTFRRSVRLDGGIAGGATGLILVGSFLPDYRLVAAPAVAYLMLWLALALGRFPRLVVSQDLSYGTYVYAFPLQQALLVAGFTTAWLPFALASVAVTLPIAACSWFLVEKPMLLRSRVRASTSLDQAAGSAR